MPSSRFLKSTFLLASGFTLFLSGCLSGVTDERGSKDSQSALAVGMATTSTQPTDISGWVDADIGVVGQAGSSTVSEASATVRGSGADIWGPADGFHFKYTINDFRGAGYTLTARVTGLQSTDPWAKAGIMFRQNLTPNHPMSSWPLRPPMAWPSSAARTRAARASTPAWPAEHLSGSA